MGPPLPVCFVASKYTSLHCYTFCYPPSITFISPEKLYYPAGWFPGEKHTSVYNGGVNESKSGLAVCNKTSSCHSWQCREYDMSARLPLGIKKWQSSTEEWAWLSCHSACILICVTLVCVLIQADNSELFGNAPICRVYKVCCCDFLILDSFWFYLEVLLFRCSLWVQWLCIDLKMFFFKYFWCSSKALNCFVFA